MPSSQLIAVPRHTPLLQTSFVVQALASLQTVPLALLTCWQTPKLHESVVHALLSSQFMGVPEQTPLAQRSPVVQALPSLQVFVL